MRNIVILSSLAFLAIVGGIVFFAGKAGFISADTNSKDCKFYTFSDQKTYSRNSTVSFGLKNDKYSKCKIKIRDDIGAWSVVDSSNKQIYKASSAGTSINNLKPGERADWKWDMSTNSGTSVPAGKYKIKFTSIEKDIEFTVQ